MCTNLANLIIPNSVRNVDRLAFYDCTNLIDINYDGTQDDWNKIDISEYNEPLTNATIHYIAPTQPTTTLTTSTKAVSKPKSAKFKKVKAAKKAVSVEWKKVSGVKGYQVQVATDKKFKKNKKTATVKKQKTTKVTIKKLKAKKKYYVRIRTYKTVKGKKIYSSWSNVKKVKTK